MRSSTRITLAAALATVLGSAPIGSTFRSQGWAGYAWFGVLVIMCAALFARRARVPAAVVPVVGLVALLLYVTVAFTPQHAVFGLFPTPESLRQLRATVQLGFDDVRTLTTPAPTTVGLELLAAGGVGLVAIVIDTVAVGLRRPAAAGLVLLAMYAVPTAVAFDGVGWVPFALGACGYLVLLLAEGHERTLQWGRPVPYDDVAGRETQSWPIRTSGKRIGMAALAIAVLLPVITPGVDNNALYLLLGGGNGDGDSGTQQLGGSSLSPFTQMRNQLLLPKPQDIMEIQTNEDNPYYVRQKILDAVDAEGNWKWAQPRPRGGDDAAGEIRLPDGIQLSNDEPRYRATVHINDHYSDITLPLEGVPLNFSGLTGWRYIAEVMEAYTRQGTTRDLSYSESYLDPHPSEQTLRESPQVDDATVTSDWGRVPRGLPAQVTDTVQTVTRDASTPYERTMAIFQYFLRSDSGFVYSLSTKPGTSGNALVDFLTNKQGFCQQYASAMAVMLRVAGVPSRVVLGYTPGRKRDNKWVIRTDDAHAWVEAYFANVGWVAYDPTPLPDGRRIEQPYAPRPGATTPEDNGTDSPEAAPTPQSDPNNIPQVDRQASSAAPASNDSLVSARTIGAILGVLLVLALLLTPMVARRTQRRRRLRGAAQGDAVGAAHGAWDEVMATVEDHRVTVPAADTPRSTARRLTEELHLAKPAAAGLRLVALAEERARYAPTAGVGGDLPTAVRAVRRGMRAVGTRRRRMRAVLLPPSVVRRMVERTVRGVTQVSSRVSRLGAAVRRPLSFSRR